MSDMDLLKASDVLDAAADAERLAVQFSGLVSLAALLRNIGSLRQAGDEAKARLEQLVGEHQRQMAHCDDEYRKADRKLQEIETKVTGTQQIIEDAEAKAAEIVGQAEADGVRIRAGAKGVVETAKANAKLIEDDANTGARQLVAQAQTRAAELDGKAKAEQAFIDAKRAELQQAENQLAAIRAEIDALMKKFRPSN